MNIDYPNPWIACDSLDQGFPERVASNKMFKALFKQPVCAVLHNRQGTLRGYALRLGSVTYPHIKLQVVHHEALGPCVFSVDTHDELDLDPDHPDAEGWARLQTANRQLKERIERAWEADGLLTFNGLLRRELGRTT